LERGLAQKDRAFAGWRTFDNCLRVDAAIWHLNLHGVDVERAWCQMVDVRTLEGNNVSDQAMCIVEAMVKLGTDVGMIMPAESLQHFCNEDLRITFIKATIGFCLFDKRNCARREDLALRENLFRFCTQLFVRNQVKAQERREHTEWIVLECCIVDRAEGGGMHW